MFRIRLKFTKEDPIKYLGHLDMMKLLERAIRRADLPMLYSQGFCPKIKLSIAWPLSVGMTSSCEYADIQLDKLVSPDKIAPLLNSVLPAGCRILSASLVDPKQKSLTEQVSEARWKVIENNPEKTVHELLLPAGPKNNTRVQDMFPKTAQIERVELVLSS